MSEQESLVHLDPAKVLADDNTRFNLSPVAVSTLKDSILEHGGVMEPVEVEALNPPSNGFTHRLTMGFMRHAAVAALNAEQNAGLLLPAIVRNVDPTDRLKRQIAENNDRASLSPMDKSVSIKRLIDAGVDKKEVRRIFSSAGGRKGNTVQPMSNAMLNIHLRMLELPKTIQDKIHDGRVGVAAAYTLGKVPPDRRADVLERAEKDRLSQIMEEERDEKKYLEAEAKVSETADKVKAAETEVQTAKAEVTQAEANIKEKTAAFAKVKNAIAVMDTPVQKSDVEQLKAAEADKKAAEKLAKEAKNKLAKALGTVKTAAELAEESKAKLEAARKAVKSTKKKDKAIGEGDIKAAAKKEGAKTTGAAPPLSMSEFRQDIKDMLKDGVPARVSQIAKVLADHLDGKGFGVKDLISQLGVITGELKLVVHPKPAAAATMPPAPDVQQGPVPKVKAAK
jgi:ParB-like chromosome segregation protein Spo0J